MRAQIPLLLTVCGSLLHSRHAVAQVPADSTIRLFYEDSAGCSTSARVTGDVSKATGISVFEPSAPNVLRVVVGHAADSGQIEASYSLHGRNDEPLGSRQDLHGASCEELMTVLVFSLNLTVQSHVRNVGSPAGTPASTAAPSSSALPSERPPTASPPTAPRPTAPPSPSTRAEETLVIRAESPPRAPQRPWMLRTGAAFLVGLGFGPSATWGVSAEAGVWWRTPPLPWPAMSLVLEGRALPPTSFPASAHGIQTELEVQTYMASLVPCLHVDRFAACAVLSVGALDVAAHDPDGAAQAGHHSGPLAAAGIRPGMELPLFRFLSLRAMVEALVPFVIPAPCVRITSAGGGECSETTTFWTFPPITGTLFIGATGHFF